MLDCLNYILISIIQQYQMASILCKLAPCNPVFAARIGALEEVLPSSSWAVVVLVEDAGTAAVGSLGCNLVFLPQRCRRQAVDVAIEGRVVIIEVIGPVCGHKCGRKCQKSLDQLAVYRCCLRIELFFPLECCNLNFA
jgi:hypothetical protein